jgi:hypothetical protein
MEVLFEGICLWETDVRKPNVVGIMRNAAAGDVIDGINIPPHTACVIVQSDKVDDSQWNEAPRQDLFRNQPHLIFFLHGEEITFDPPPAGGTVASLQTLPPAGCSAGKVLDPDMLSANASAVAARIELPSSANLSVVKNRVCAQIALLSTDAIRLVARRFDGTERSLSFDAGAQVIVANVDLPVALDDPSTGNDEDHARLYCRMFTAPQAAAPNAVAALSGNARPVRTFSRRARHLRRIDFLTLGGGCSNSHYP